MQKFWLVDRFPFRKYFFTPTKPLGLIPSIVKHIPLWFPGATFRRVGEEGKHLGMQVRMLAYDLITKDIVRVMACHFNHVSPNQPGRMSTRPKILSSLGI